MAAFALGSQTQGSVIRPASYCQVAGFKPTYGLLPLNGVLAFAPSLDTAGLFTQTADDMALLWERMGFPIAGAPAARLAKTRMGVPAGVEERLRADGWRIEEVNLPFDFDEVLAAVKTVNVYEGSRTHESRWREFGERIGAKLALLVREGLAVSLGPYEDALEFLRLSRERMIAFYDQYPVVLSLAAAGPAPIGLASTGDPRMNAPWTGLRGPAICIPCGEVGLQLTAAPGADALLVATAAAVESVPGILGECPIPLH
jgi:Asp-tRNA(Asn)/Glu-tRNA(Gln) amidotransferase A subunit family amidase